MEKDYQTHVFTSTYTADVSGVCSAMYELGGMSVLHDPSGCNSTYSTHDEPRWFDTDSLMFVSGLDEAAAVMGDDEVLINDVCAAAADLEPRFITLCGASIPHIIAFDYRGVARLIEKRCHIPVLPVPTDGLRSYISGIGLALSAWLDRFADPALYAQRKAQAGPDAPVRVNLMGVTPLDFSIGGNLPALRRTFEEAGIEINCAAAMGESFDSLQKAYDADMNVVVSSAGRAPAALMRKKSGMPFTEGLPAGEAMTRKLLKAVRGGDSALSGPFENTGRFRVPEGKILVIGEEIFARSLSTAINALPGKDRMETTACPFWPDVDLGMPEAELIRAMRSSAAVIADPLYRIVLRPSDRVRFIPFPHEAYSGRIYRAEIPVFASGAFDVKKLLA